MKRIITISLLVVSIFLVGCSFEITNPFSKIDPWGKDDFMLYSEDGKIIERPTAGNDYYIVAEAPEDGATYRGVVVGDDAIEALAKYDLCYGNAVYGSADADMPETLTADVDIESLIITSEEEIMFLFAFDEEYNPVDIMALVEEGLNSDCMFGFMVEEGKISQIIIAQRQG